MRLQALVPSDSPCQTVSSSGSTRRTTSVGQYMPSKSLSYSSTNVPIAGGVPPAYINPSSLSLTVHHGDLYRRVGERRAPEDVLGHQEGLLAILSKDHHRTTQRTEHRLSSPTVISGALSNCLNDPTTALYDTKVLKTHLPDISYVLNGLCPADSVSLAEAYFPPQSQSVMFPNAEDQDSHLSLFSRSSKSEMMDSLFSTDPNTFSTVCEPLSIWLADYLWQVTTKGINLSPAMASIRSSHYPRDPLPVLAESISSLMLSTLLQPSVIVLALYYIARLPSYIGPNILDVDPESPSHRFKVALTDVDETLHDSSVTQALYACFKLFVTGAILSNKVLDDHVFTMQTWHGVSGIPLRVLNRLEWLSLDLLSHELYVDPSEWGLWVRNLARHYHSSSCQNANGDIPSIPSLPVIDCMFECLVATSLLPVPQHSSSQPIFLGIEQRVQAKRLEAELQQTAQYGFELDDDGPLRREYIPRGHLTDSRVSGLTLNIDDAERYESFGDAIQSARNFQPLPTRFQESASRAELDSSVSWPPTPMDASPIIPETIGDRFDAYSNGFHQSALRFSYYGVSPPTTVRSSGKKQAPATLCEYYLSRSDIPQYGDQC